MEIIEIIPTYVRSLPPPLFSSFHWQKYPLELHAMTYRTDNDFAVVGIYVYYYKFNMLFKRLNNLKISLARASALSFNEMVKDPRKTESIYRLAHWGVVALAMRDNDIAEKYEEKLL